MRVVIQRVDNACVSAYPSTGDAITGSIAQGILVYVCVESGDTEKEYRWIANKLFNIRIFNDEQDNMNLSVLDTQGEILIVSNFTLLGDARKGNRPSFSSGISVAEAREKYDAFMETIRTLASELSPPIKVEAGVFGAHMKVESKGNGPVNIILDSI